MISLVWFFIGIVFGASFILFGVLPYGIKKVIEENVGITFEETINDKTYEVEIRERR